MTQSDARCCVTMSTRVRHGGREKEREIIALRGDGGKRKREMDNLGGKDRLGKREKRGEKKKHRQKGLEGDGEKD